MDRFGLAPIILTLALLMAPAYTCGHRDGSLAKQAAVASPPVVQPHAPEGAGVLAVVESDGRTYQVLVGEKPNGHFWSAAISE